MNPAEFMLDLVNTDFVQEEDTARPLQLDLCSLTTSDHTGKHPAPVLIFNADSLSFLSL